MRFLVKTGRHTQHDITYLPGQVVDSDEDLVAIHGAKFERLRDDVTTTTPTPILAAPLSPSPPAPVEEVKDTGGASDTVEWPLGLNVTTEFPNAGKVGLCVFRKGSFYQVTELGDVSVPLNKIKLRRVRVNDFIDSYTPEGDQ